MANAFFKLPDLSNEKVLDFRPGSPENAALKAALEEFMTSQTEVFQHINGQKISTDTRIAIHPPHLFRHELGHFHKGSAVHVQQAIDAALKAKPAWEALSWEDRAAIFLKAADLLAGPYRARMNAATMLGQSKNVFQAEIDCVAELCDIWRLNAAFMAEIFSGQPQSTAQVWNRMEYRPLEGFYLPLHRSTLLPLQATCRRLRHCLGTLLSGSRQKRKPFPQLSSWKYWKLQDCRLGSST